jgi:hypothetical protein
VIIISCQIIFGCTLQLSLNLRGPLQVLLFRMYLLLESPVRRINASAPVTPSLDRERRGRVGGCTDIIVGVGGLRSGRNPQRKVQLAPILFQSLVRSALRCLSCVSFYSSCSRLRLLSRKDCRCAYPSSVCLSIIILEISLLFCVINSAIQAWE